MRLLMTVLVLGLLPVSAAWAADDGFGDTYFTAQAPAAFGDNNAMALSDKDADAVMAIEPAAGDAPAPADQTEDCEEPDSVE